jgi:hypothetical protein
MYKYLPDRDIAAEMGWVPTRMELTRLGGLLAIE